MQTLYLTDPTCVLEKIGKVVRLSQDGRLITRVYLSSLRQVFLFGQTQVPTDTMAALAAAGVPVVWLTAHGRFIARLEGPPVGAPSLRRAQYLATDDPTWALANSRAVLRCKLLAAIGLLRRHARNHERPELFPVVAELQRTRREMVFVAHLAKLRGLEGRAGAVYFSSWRSLLRQDLDFVRRTRRPATDPTNALLGLSYGLIRIEIESHLTGLGLDPRVGFLHVQRGQRPALALDLLEEFRAEICDRLVLRCLNRRRIREPHFVLDETGACRLTAEGRTLFMQQYESFLEKPWKDMRGRRTNYRRLLHVQCREFCDAIRQRRTYTPHQPRI